MKDFLMELLKMLRTILLICVLFILFILGGKFEATDEFLIYKTNYITPAIIINWNELDSIDIEVKYHDSKSPKLPSGHRLLVTFVSEESQIKWEGFNNSLSTDLREPLTFIERALKSNPNVKIVTNIEPKSHEEWLYSTSRFTISNSKDMYLQLVDRN